MGFENYIFGKIDAERFYCPDGQHIVADSLFKDKIGVYIPQFSEKIKDFCTDLTLPHIVQQSLNICSERTPYSCDFDLKKYDSFVIFDSGYSTSPHRVIGLQKDEFIPFSDFDPDLLSVSHQKQFKSLTANIDEYFRNIQNMQIYLKGFVNKQKRDSFNKDLVFAPIYAA